MRSCERERHAMNPSNDKKHRNAPDSMPFIADKSLLSSQFNSFATHSSLLLKQSSIHRNHQ